MIPTLHVLRDAPRSALVALALVLASLAPPAAIAPARDGERAFEAVSRDAPVGRVDAGSRRLFAGELSVRAGLDRPPITPGSAWLSPRAPRVARVSRRVGHAPRSSARLAATLSRSRRARLCRHRRTLDDDDDDDA